MHMNLYTRGSRIWLYAVCWCCLLVLPGVCGHCLWISSRRCGGGALPPSARGTAAQTGPALAAPPACVHARCSGARGSGARAPRGPATPHLRLETLKPTDKVNLPDTVTSLDGLGQPATQQSTPSDSEITY